VAKERIADFKKWKLPALFLSPATNAHGDGRLNPKVINTIWNEDCALAGLGDHTPHDARHVMGLHLIEKPAISQRFKDSSITPMRPIRFSTPGSLNESWLRHWMIGDLPIFFRQFENSR
jgi:integrase